MSRLLSRQSSGEGSVYQSSSIGCLDRLTEAAKDVGVDEARVAVVRGFPRPDLVDLVVRALLLEHKLLQ